MFRAPKPNDVYVLPSGAQVIVLKVAKNESIICHYLTDIGARRRGKAAEVVFREEFLIHRCSRKRS